MQPVQLRLGFAAPTRPVRMALMLSGLFALVDVDRPQADVAFAYLSAAGAAPQIDEQGDIRFPVARIRALGELPEQVHIDGDDLLEPLLQLVFHPSRDRLPATLTRTPSGLLMLSWEDDGGTQYDEPFLPDAAAALMHADLPFEATHEAWQSLRQSCDLPMLLGQARLNLDGYVEIVTTAPQMVEVAPLPGLFRLDETHFGVALAHASALMDNPAFRWEGPPPLLERGPLIYPPLPPDVDSSHGSALRELVDQLAAYRAAALVADPGQGHRAQALAAVTALDAWPALIVAAPHMMSVWNRLLRQHGRAPDRAEGDVLLVSYDEVRQLAPSSSPLTLLFDDLDVAASEAEWLAGCRSFGGLRDVYRLGLLSQEPESLDAAVRLMSVLRPGEFPDDAPLVHRYPLQPRERGAAHVGVYLRQMPSTTQEHVGYDEVLLLERTDAQRRAAAQARAQISAPPALLQELREIATAGPADGTSPKVAVAAACVKRAQEQRRRIVVLTCHERAASLLCSVLRSAHPSRTLGDGAAVTVLTFQDQLPALHHIDEVVLMDYPASIEDVLAGCGAAGAGPRIVQLHVQNTVDDRLAALVWRRRSPASSWTDTEITYLLG